MIIRGLILFILLTHSIAWAGQGMGPGPGFVVAVGGGGGGVTITDDFNRADENPLAAPWTQIHTFNKPRLVDQALRSTEFPTAWAYYNQAVADDQFAQIKMSALSSDNGVTLRSNSGRNALENIGYSVMYNDGNILIRKWTLDFFTNLNSVSATGLIVAGDILRGEISGSTITAKVNGATVLTATDSTYASGFVGISVKGQYGDEVDDFQGGDL